MSYNVAVDILYHAAVNDDYGTRHKNACHLQAQTEREMHRIINNGMWSEIRHATMCVIKFNGQWNSGVLL